MRTPTAISLRVSWSGAVIKFEKICKGVQMNRILLNGAGRGEFDLIGYGEGEIDDLYDEGVGGTEELWGSPDRLDALEMGEEPFHAANDTVSEFFAESEPGIFNDSAELAEAIDDR